MGLVLDQWDRVKRYYKFERSEIKGLIIAILIIAFIISFKEWGDGDQINIAVGLFNLFNSLLIVTLTFLVHTSIQRIWALSVGYRIEWKMWGMGLLIGLIFAFVSNGNLWILLPGGFLVHHMSGHRLGQFRYGINYWSVGLSAAVGPIATMSLAIFFTAVSGVVETALIAKIITFNIAFALFTMLPIPPLDGSRSMYGSRMFYVFSVCGLVATAILLQSGLGIILTMFSAFLIAAVLWLLYYIMFENRWWPGG